MVFRFSAITGILIRVRPDPVLPSVFSLQQAVKAGLTATQAERRVAIGRWRRLRRGAFCLEERWQAAAPEQRHVLLAFAVYLANVNSWTPYAFSHASAAALWGLPVSRALLASVVVTVDPTSRRRPRRTAT